MFGRLSRPALGSFHENVAVKNNDCPDRVAVFNEGDMKGASSSVSHTILSLHHHVLFKGNPYDNISIIFDQVR